MTAINTNSLSSARQLLQHYGLGFSYPQLKEDLLSHPDYPSLFAMHQVLDKYGLQNSPVEASGENLDELGQPFISYMQLPGKGNDFAMVSKVANGTITYINTKGRSETISRDTFLDQWQNIAIKVEYAKDGIDAGKSVIRKPEPRIPYLLGIIFLVFLVGVTSLSAASPLVFVPWLLLKMSGLAVTVLLLMYEADRQNETVKQFCSASKTVNCDAVLQSKGAKIANFSWSEIGFAYFAGTLLFLIIQANSPIALLPLALLSVAVVPYTIYSIYYQFKVLRQWCRLCLFIQAIILAEAVFVMLAVLMPSAWPLVRSAWQPGLLLLPLLVLPLIAWLLLKPSFQEAATADEYKYAYLRQQNNPDVFAAMLRRQPAAPDGIAACSLLMGNPNASQYIIKICNPFCGPCAAAHPILENIVEKYDVRLYVLFTGTNNEGDKIGMVAKHFIDIYKTLGADAAKAAMHWWYASQEKSMGKLQELYPVNNLDGLAAERLEQMQAWNKAANIQYTPTVYVNGYRLPEAYTVVQLEKMFGYE